MHPIGIDQQIETMAAKTMVAAKPTMSSFLLLCSSRRLSR